MATSPVKDSTPLRHQLRANHNEQGTVGESDDKFANIPKPHHTLQINR